MTMNDDTLILYYYDDGLSDEERAGVAAALAADAALRERYRALTGELERLKEQPTAAPPQPVKARWHQGIERAAAAGRSAGRPGRRLPWLALALPLAGALLVAGILIGLHLGARSTPVPASADRGGAVAGDRDPGGQVIPAAFSRGLEFHLRRSRQEIAQLDGEPGRRLLIMDILRQNRVFERAARDNDAEDVARVLRAFEPVLLRLADDRTSAEDAAALRSRLAFELDVVLTKMQRRDSDQTNSI